MHIPVGDETGRIEGLALGDFVSKVGLFVTGKVGRLVGTLDDGRVVGNLVGNDGLEVLG